MNLKNLNTCCELRSENRIEASELLKASMRSYSPRSAGIMPNNDRMIVLLPQEASEFVSGVLRDVNLAQDTKWAISTLVSEWASGAITEEAATDTESA